MRHGEELIEKFRKQVDLSFPKLEERVSGAITTGVFDNSIVKVLQRSCFERNLELKMEYDDFDFILKKLGYDKVSKVDVICLVKYFSKIIGASIIKDLFSSYPDFEGIIKRALLIRKESSYEESLGCRTTTSKDGNVRVVEALDSFGKIHLSQEVVRKFNRLEENVWSLEYVNFDYWFYVETRR